jgi:hypothetical protein
MNKCTLQSLFVRWVVPKCPESPLGFSFYNADQILGMENQHGEPQTIASHHLTRANYLLY